uniref:X-box-binding protein 1 n=1 Tax=Ciona savignyi TaxID=51511 RepID=H2YU00_CIOSA
MPFSNVKGVMPVLPKPEHISPEGMQENIPLSAIEDKELRKKLRNRQSALAARERKKARMMELEKQVAELQETNRRMEDENQHLKARLDTIVQRCLRAGFPLDGSSEISWVRVNDDTGRTMQKAGYLQSYQKRRPLSFTSPNDPRVVGNPLRIDQNAGRITTELHLKNTIRAIGDRHEVYQTLQAGTTPVQTTEAKYGNQPYYQQHYKTNTNVVVKQEFNAVAQPYTLRGVEQIEQNRLCTNSPDAPQSTQIPGQQTSPKRDWATANQTLPSIGAMLAPNTKRTCLSQENGAAVEDTELEKCSPTNNVGFLMRGKNKPRPVNVIQPVTCASQITATNRGEKVDSKTTNATTLSAGDSTSPSPLLMPDSEDFLAGGFDNIIENDNSQNGFTIFDIEEIIRADSCVDSPSPRSGSDSGLSMDDSLDWIADNPIFNF